MDIDVVLQKIESLQRCIMRIESKLPLSITDLEKNLDLQDVIVFNLERVVQQAVDIGVMVLIDLGGRAPGTMSGTFDSLGTLGFLDAETCGDMKRAVGFRNIAVHEYKKLSLAVVHNVVTSHLGAFKHFIAYVLKHIAGSKDNH